MSASQANALAVLQRVEADRQRDRDAPVDAPFDVSAQVEDVLVTKLELAVQRPDDASVEEEVEVVGDRDRPAAVGHEANHPAPDRPDAERSRAIATSSSSGP